jgi:hypothetical protein
MTKKLVVTKDPAKMTEEDVLSRARELFTSMQKSWWEFAKLIYTIREGETYKVKGFDTFRDYCESDYPETNYKTIVKFCTIVDSWGKSIDAKFARDENFSLPAYESCYAVISVKDGILPKEEVDRLKKDVLEKKLSYHKLREKMKDLIDSMKREKKIIAKTSDEINDLEKQLNEEIEDEEIDIAMDTEEDSESLFDSFDEEEMEELAPQDYESKADALIAKSLKYSKDLNQTLKLLQEKMPTISYSKKLGEFGTELNSLLMQINEILEAIEEKE